MIGKRWLRRALRGAGYDIVRFAPGSHPLARRARLLQHLGIDLVFDVGANTGQFGRQLREEIGYRGRIVSFEPMRAAFAGLAAAAAGDPDWRTFNCALGAQSGAGAINIAGNSASSSLLDMLPLHAEAAPGSRTVSREPIEVRTLDSLLPEVLGGARAVWLKIDTQGYEAEVLKGAGQALRQFAAVQLELSLAPLYAGAPLASGMLGMMAEAGFVLAAVEDGFTEATTGRMLQIDGIFVREQT